MKLSQNDQIMLIVGAVVCIGAVAAAFFTQPEPTPPAAPQAVDTSEPMLTPGAVVKGDSLPGGGSGAGGFGGGAGGFGGPPAGVGGPPPGAGGNPFGGGGGGAGEDQPMMGGTMSN